MASLFPASVAAGYEHATRVQNYTPSTDAIVVSSLVYFDTGTQTIKLCGADPALIAGIAEGAKNTAQSASERTNLHPSSKMPVRLLSTGALVALSSPTTLSEANVGVLYGIVNVGGVWQLDTTDTTNTRVLVERVDVGTNTAFVRFIAANLQFDAVAS